jgi:hypothetical protein
LVVWARTGPAFTVGPCAATFGTTRAQLFAIYFAVLVFIQFLQGSGRASNLLFIEDAIAIRVQRGHDWHYEAGAARAGARTGAGSSLSRWAIWRILSKANDSADSYQTQGYNRFDLHTPFMT